MPTGLISFPTVIIRSWTRAGCLGVWPRGLSEAWGGLNTLCLRNLENKSWGLSAFSSLQPEDSWFNNIPAGPHCRSRSAGEALPGPGGSPQRPTLLDSHGADS